MTPAIDHREDRADYLAADPPEVGDAYFDELSIYVNEWLGECEEEFAT